ncbi:MAG: DNA polymerase III subunit alpha, partial [Candidatus Hadarchaeales archaeon]
MHSYYSFLDGVCSPTDLVRAAKEMGFEALALTDHGNLCGCLELAKSAQEYGIKPVLGLEAYLTKGSWGIDRLTHLTLLAQNLTGYKNLVLLSTRAFRDNFFRKPQVDPEWLEEARDGLICLTGCGFSPIGEALKNGQTKKAEEILEFFVSIFGRDHTYVELQYHGLKEQATLNARLVEVAKRLGLHNNLVATNDAHYAFPEQKLVQDVLLCINTKQTLSSSDRFVFPNNFFCLRSTEEMQMALGEFEGALNNTLRIVDMVEAYSPIPPKNGFRLPRFEVPEGFESSKEYLRYLVREALKEKFPHGKVPEAVKKRVRKEMEVIEYLKFEDYILIVWDIVRFAKARRIPIGPGRGSVGGSYIAYLLGITALDPMRYDLLFERFLHLGRKELPDIDLDFSQDRRDEVFAYLQEKYGADKVAKIGTFDVIKDKLAIRDVTRVFGYSFTFGSKLTALLGDEGSLEALLKRTRNSKEEAEVLEMAAKIVGIPRHSSVHAAGVVVSDIPLVETIPLMRSGGGKGELVTQYDMGAIEEAGFLKIDLLGSRTLDVIEETLQSLKEEYGEEEEKKARSHLSSGRFDDQAAWELLQEGKTLGLFQVEGAGMTTLLMEASPNSLEELTALIALYRPGPLKGRLHERYLAVKKGEQAPSYPHLALKDILAETGGVIIYQEQILRMAQDIAGFSPEEADTLRKAIGKKIPSLLAAHKEKWMQGATPRLGTVAAEMVWRLIENFGGYGFNKSHAAAYAMVSYYTAYLKANYPMHYLAAYLNSVSGQSQRLLSCVRAARKEGFRILPPTVNKSELRFTPVGDAVYYGLGAIKTVGEKRIAPLLEERARNGEFRDLRDFVCRCREWLRKDLWLALSYSGALDCFGRTRKSLVENVEEICGKQTRKLAKLRGKESHVLSIFDVPPGEGENHEEDEDRWWESMGVFFSSEELPPKAKRQLEREYLGGVLASEIRLGFLKVPELRDGVKVVPIESLISLSEGEMVTVQGLLSIDKEISDRFGRPMAFGTLSDDTGSVSVTLFHALYADKRPYLEHKEEVPFVVTGRLERSGENCKVIAEEATLCEVEIIEDNNEKEVAPLAASVSPLDGGSQVWSQWHGLFLPTHVRASMERLAALIREEGGSGDGTLTPIALIGEEGTGKLSLARRFAEEIGVLPEEVVVIPPNLTAKDLRIRLDRLNARPPGGRRRCVILEAVDRWGAVKANSILKSLEEPAPSVQFVLICHSRRGLPPTVLSRCLTFDLPLLPSALGAEALRERGIGGGSAAPSLVELVEELG